MNERKKVDTVKPPEDIVVPKGFEHLAKPAIQEDAKDKIAAKIYDIDDFTVDTEAERSVVIDGMGIVKFKALNYIEAREVYMTCRKLSIKDIDLQGLAIIAKMMNKVDGKTTYDKLVKKSLAEVTALSQTLGNQAGFLQTPTTT